MRRLFSALAVVFICLIVHCACLECAVAAVGTSKQQALLDVDLEKVNNTETYQLMKTLVKKVNGLEIMSHRLIW